MNRAWIDDIRQLLGMAPLRACKGDEHPMLEVLTPEGPFIDVLRCPKCGTYRVQVAGAPELGWQWLQPDTYNKMVVESWGY